MTLESHLIIERFESILSWRKFERASHHTTFFLILTSLKNIQKKSFWPKKVKWGVTRTGTPGRT